MPHPEEGTVHAWLDGALSPEESRAFEARVAADPALQAAVAEARGLIAASSRILGALDATPGKVAPRSSAAGDVVRIDALRARAAAKPAAPRFFRAQRWAAAAVLVVAVGVGVLWKSGSAPVTPADVAQSRAAGERAAVAPMIASPEAAGAEGTPAITSGGAASGRAGAPAATGTGPGGAGTVASAAAPAEAFARDGERGRTEVRAMEKKAAGAAQDLAAGRGVADAAGALKGAEPGAAPAAAKVSAENAPARERALAAKDEAPGKLAEDTKGKVPAEVAAKVVPATGAAPAAAAAPLTAPAAAPPAALALGRARNAIDSVSQRGARQAPATAILTETMPDPRLSDIGCRTITFGEWSPALSGVRPQAQAALDSQRVAVGWRRARLLSPGDARSYQPGTWFVERDSAVVSLPDLGTGASLRAAISLRSGAGSAMVLNARGEMLNRAPASWAVQACPGR